MTSSLIAVATAAVAALASLEASSAKEGHVFTVRPLGDRGPLVAYDMSTARKEFVLPPGMASADGRIYYTRSYYTVDVRRSVTRLRAYEIASGRQRATWLTKGGWQLAGVSPTGRWLALTRIRTRRGSTTIAIVDGERRAVAHILSLRGDFEVETMSSDGKRLFLVEHLRALGPARYRIRLYDLSRERLVADPLSAKGRDEVMAGLAWGGVGSPDGRWLLTLYLNTTRNTAFVHALDLQRARPACIELPTGARDRTKLARYTLTLAPSGDRLFAANAALGVVSEVDLSRSRVVRTARFAPVRSAGRARSAIARNGRTLYFSAGRKLWAYDAPLGRVRGPYSVGDEVTGLGFTPDDRRLLVARAHARVAVLDVVTGWVLRP